jgi:Asp-tRNA(Asn)/Glu-tRNA(Gln) amidotransferase B subunit
MTHELLGQLSARKETFADNSLTSDHLGELIDLVQNGTITGLHFLRYLLAIATTNGVPSIRLSYLLATSSVTASIYLFTPK